MSDAKPRQCERTPMQWDDSKQAGLLQMVKPWIKVSQNYKKINAAQQRRSGFYFPLLPETDRHKEKDIIVYSEFEPLYHEDEQILRYTRKQDQEKLLTVCNFSDKNAEVRKLPGRFKRRKCRSQTNGRKNSETEKLF